MRRQWSTVRDHEAEGSDRSQQLGLTLAAICDPETLEKLIHLKALLDANGGQALICAYRNKYGYQDQVDANGDAYKVKVRLEDPQEPGVYETDGYLIHFDHIATTLRSRQPEREPDAKPEKPMPFPTDDDAGDLRDAIEAEVAAELEAEAAAEQEGDDDLPAGDDGSSFTGATEGE